VPNAYERYLINKFRSELKLDGTPIRIEFKSGHNPFEGRKTKRVDHNAKKKKRQKKIDGSSKK
jgi:GTP-binding protein